MLGSKENGHWTIARRKKHIVSAHRYQPHTLILDTTMETSSGTVVVTDFMPIRGDNSEEAALKLLYLALKNASKR